MPLQQPTPSAPTPLLPSAPLEAHASTSIHALRTHSTHVTEYEKGGSLGICASEELNYEAGRKKKKNIEFTAILCSRVVIVSKKKKRLG